MRYVALGDSYTIGTSVARAERWPDQLVAALGAGPRRPWSSSRTSGQRLHVGRSHPRRAAGAEPLDPDFATVAHRRQRRRPGRPAPRLRGERRDDPRRAPRAPPPATRIVTSRSPTTRSPRRAPTTATRAAARCDRRGQRDHGSAGRERGIAFVDIFDISLAAASDRSLVADDGLHPSGCSTDSGSSGSGPSSNGCSQGSQRPAVSGPASGVARGRTESVAEVGPMEFDV